MERVQTHLVDVERRQKIVLPKSVDVILEWKLNLFYLQVHSKVSAYSCVRVCPRVRDLFGVANEAASGCHHPSDGPREVVECLDLKTGELLLDEANVQSHVHRQHLAKWPFEEGESEWAIEQLISQVKKSEREEEKGEKYWPDAWPIRKRRCTHTHTHTHTHLCVVAQWLLLEDANARLVNAEDERVCRRRFRDSRCQRWDPPSELVNRQQFVPYPIVVVAIVVVVASACVRGDEK
jgi:hypothetical protein